jgi:cytoskeletal protein CcmA (bactofilin family)
MFNKSPLFSHNDPSRRDGATSASGARPSENSGGSSPLATKEALAHAPTVTAPATVRPATERLPVTAASAAPESGMGARLIVGPEVKLKGAEILDCDTLVVEGRVEATMDSRVIRIAESGAFIGKVSIDIAEIHGSFEGELTARSQLIIHSTGRVKGTIRYGRLVADDGGELCGDVAVIAPSSGSKPKTTTETSLILAEDSRPD